jgi:hypothetical protein
MTKLTRESVTFYALHSLREELQFSRQERQRVSSVRPSFKPIGGNRSKHEISADRRETSPGNRTLFHLIMP